MNGREREKSYTEGEKKEGGNGAKAGCIGAHRAYKEPSPSSETASAASVLYTKDSCNAMSPSPPFLPLPSPQLLACFAPIANTRNGASLPSPFPTVLFLVSEGIITHSSHSRYPKTSPPPSLAMESRFSPGAASHRHDMFCINVPQINGRLHQFVLRLSSLGETQSSHIKLRRRRTGASVLPGGEGGERPKKFSYGMGGGTLVGWLFRWRPREGGRTMVGRYDRHSLFPLLPHFGRSVFFVSVGRLTCLPSPPNAPTPSHDHLKDSFI